MYKIRTPNNQQHTMQDTVFQCSNNLSRCGLFIYFIHLLHPTQFIMCFVCKIQHKVQNSKPTSEMMNDQDLI